MRQLFNYNKFVQCFHREKIEHWKRTVKNPIYQPIRELLAKVTDSKDAAREALRFYRERVRRLKMSLVHKSTRLQKIPSILLDDISDMGKRAEIIFELLTIDPAFISLPLVSEEIANWLTEEAEHIIKQFVRIITPKHIEQKKRRQRTSVSEKESTMYFAIIFDAIELKRRFDRSVARAAEYLERNPPAGWRTRKARTIRKHYKLQSDFYLKYVERQKLVHAIQVSLS